MAKRLLAIVGGAVTLGCVAFFLKALFDVLSGLEAETLGADALVATAVLCLCYAFMLLLPAEGWRLLLRAAEPDHAPRCRLVGIYALTQFAKYLPGNVFHLAGRHAILTREGFAQRALLVSAFQENLLVVLSAGLVGTVMVIIFPGPAVANWLQATGMPQAMFSPVARSAGGLALVLVAVAAIGSAFRRSAKIGVYRTLALDCAFFILQGVSFALLMYAVSGEVHLETLGVVTLSWIAGFLAPGAPGGAGVREVVMLFLLGGSIGQGDVVLAAALYRIVTFSGDLLFFGYGLLRTRFHIGHGEDTRPESPTDRPL